MSETSKTPSQKDSSQAIRGSFNDVDASLTTNGFLVGKVGHKIAFATSTTTVSNDTVTISFSDSGTALYAYKLIYTDDTQTTLISAERTS